MSTTSRRLRQSEDVEVFEMLIRRFGELSNETARERFGPRATDAARRAMMLVAAVLSARAAAEAADAPLGRFHGAQQ
jgi:hypothetical protein